MVTKKTAEKAQARGAVNKETLRGMLSSVPGLPAAQLEDEATRILGFLKIRPELQGRLDAGALTVEQLRAMAHADATVSMGQASDSHTQRELEKYLGGNRAG